MRGRDLARFERKFAEKSDSREGEPEWVWAFDEWVNVYPGEGALRIQESTVNAQQIVERRSDKIEMPYRPDLKSDMRLIVDNQVFGIVQARDREWRHEFYDLEVIAEDSTKVVTT